jgi:hypothetical protein
MLEVVEKIGGGMGIQGGARIWAGGEIGEGGRSRIHD